MEIQLSVQNDRNIGIIQEFRANAGKVGGPFAGKSLLLLHTMGQKAGKLALTRSLASVMGIGWW